MNNQPIILAIDTSCDDTSIAITQGHTVLSNIIASQTQLHKEYGGVFPTVAKQAHKENIDPSIAVAMKRAHLSTDWDKIDAIAVTQGPGLAPSLEIGINKAKELAKQHNKPLIAVNHIEGHTLSALAERSSKRSVIPTEVEGSLSQPPEKGCLHAGRHDTSTRTPHIAQRTPSLALVVSGGHTQFILVKQIGDYQILGTTIDDAAGEALDKVGRMLDLGYPAGSVIEQFAKKGDPKKFNFPLPMTTTKNYDLSFSGLKTFARNLIEELEGENQLDKQAVYDFAASFQYAVFRHIIYKLSKLIEDKEIFPKGIEDLGNILLGGGVAANMELRKMIRELLRELQQTNSQKLKTPYSKKLCSDNAAMIGIVAYHKYLRKEFVGDIEGLDRKPRWKID